MLLRVDPHPAPLPRPRRARRLLASALALASVTALAACTTSGADEQTRSAGQTGYVGVSGNLTRIAPDLRRAVPPVTGTRLGSDASLSSADYAGKVVVVNIWGSWCPPCRAEAPDLQAASVATQGRAQFLGVTVKDYDPAPAEAFVRAFSITYPSIYDPTGQVLLTFAGDLPPSAIPSTLVIDKQGRLAARVLGPVTTSTLVGMVDDVADGK